MFGVERKISLVILTVVVSTYGSDVFTSIDKLRDLSMAEDQIIPEMDDVVEMMEKKISTLKSLVAELKENKLMSQDRNAVVGNPVQAYLLIKRWHTINNLFTNSVEQDTEEHNDEDGLNEIQNEVIDFTKEDIGSISIDCKDNNEDCNYWANIGECDKNPLYMKDQCKLSCKICRRPIAVNNDEKVIQAMLYKLLTLSNTAIPTYQDYDGTSESIVRLQRTYSLNTSNIIRGNIQGSMSIRNLTAQDCYYVGKKAYDIDEWGYAVQWLKEALRLDENGSLYYDVQVTLTEAYIKMGDYLRANITLFSLEEGNTTELGEELTTAISRLKEKIEQLTSGSELLTQPELNTLRPTPLDWVQKYEELCRGEGVESSPTAVCRYRQAGIPWNCYKEEILNMNPRISMVYDVITDKESDTLRQKAKDKMSRGVVGPSGEPSTTRISNVGWLDDDDEDPFVKSISDRVSLITELEVRLKTPYDEEMSRISADDFQAVNYGTGGHYVPHVDYFTGDNNLEGTRTEKIIQISGDRIATFLLYLTDVKAGGSTVYPKVKVQVPPIKNAAAFWYNSRLSGDYDSLTLHAGCPVLLGEKWVCNKWVREYGNEFKRKCGLTRDAGYS